MITIYYATFTIGIVRCKNIKLTDIDYKQKIVTIQLDGDKHLHIPFSKCEYILEVTKEKLKNKDTFNVVNEIMKLDNT